MDVKATLPGVDVVSALPTAIARDVVSLRGAATYRLDVGARSDVVLRAGGGFEPSMLSTAQQGVTNLVDGDKLLLGLGATLALRGVIPATLRFGAGANVQRVFGYAQDKRLCAAATCPPDSVGADNPGAPRLAGQGAFWSMALGIGGGAVRAAVGALLATLLLAGPARADAPGLFGFGARSAGLARAGVADDDAGAAAREDAALAATPGLRVRLGYGLRRAGARRERARTRACRVRRRSRRAVRRPRGPRRRRRASRSALHLPDAYLASIGFRPATEPQFVLYEAPLQRTSSTWWRRCGSAPCRWEAAPRWGSVGGDGTHFDLGQDARGTRADGDVDVEALPYRLAPVAGARRSRPRRAWAPRSAARWRSTSASTTQPSSPSPTTRSTAPPPCW